MLQNKKNGIGVPFHYYYTGYRQEKDFSLERNYFPIFSDNLEVLFRVKLAGYRSLFYYEVLISQNPQLIR